MPLSNAERQARFRQRQKQHEKEHAQEIKQEKDRVRKVIEEALAEAGISKADLFKRLEKREQEELTKLRAKM
jgi:3-methyladenine DNA glycosylase AlkD